MPNRKGSQRNTRSLSKTSHGGFGITLPIDLVRLLGWRPRQKLTVTPKGKKLIIKDWKKYFRA
jgi:hypothetical protein